MNNKQTKEWVEKKLQKARRDLELVQKVILPGDVDGLKKDIEVLTHLSRIMDVRMEDSNTVHAI